MSGTATVRVGDTLEVRGIPGAPTRRGVVLEVVGEGEHEHYRVRWDEEHESLFFPGAGEGVHTVHPRRRGRQSASASSARRASKQAR